ncbi:MAG: thioredoxin family protein [Spirulina sp. SIO3F2]|nr:thioredoxin family protein [Spirulina sp. SIO3F2]
MLTFSSALLPTLVRWLCCLLLVVGCWGFGSFSTAHAALDNDRFDGNIFVLYAGNGSLVPVHETLTQAQTQHRPVLLVFYVDDSLDCKAFAITVSRIQEAYGRRASILPINVDALPIAGQAATTNDADLLPVAPYYRGGVPQAVILDGSGNVRFDQLGIVSFETLDTVFRDVFDLDQPEADVPQLQRRAYNEFNTELTP